MLSDGRDEACLSVSFMPFGQEAFLMNMKVGENSDEEFCS